MLGAQRALEKALEEQTAATQRAMEESLRLTGQNAALKKERDARTAEAAQTRSGVRVRHDKAKHSTARRNSRDRVPWLMSVAVYEYQSMAQTVKTTSSEVSHTLVECPPQGCFQRQRANDAPVYPERPYLRT